MDAQLEAWLVDKLASQGRVIGHGYQAIVRQIASPAGEIVVKSPHPNPFLAWFGRSAIRRESRVYDRLNDIPGIPRSLGLANGEHLVLEFIQGTTLRVAAQALQARETFFNRLRTTLVAMHAAGVAHSDLKRKENIVVGPDEAPYIIDFGIAATRPAVGGLRIGPGFETACQMDWNAWIKLKHGRVWDSLPAEDAPLYKPLMVERWARKARGPWKVLSMRSARKRKRATRKG